MHIDLNSWLPWLLGVAGVAAAMYERFIGRNIWRNVAEGRGQRIDDLEKEVDNLKHHINKLEVRMDTLTTDFASRIANEVVISLKAME